MNRFDTDVLIVGAGAAGMLAALKAANIGLRTILTHKGRLAESSASWIAGADFTVIDVDAGDTITHLRADIACEGFLVNRDEHIWDYCCRCGEVESELSKYGLQFRRVSYEHGSEFRRAGFLFGWEWCQRLAVEVVKHRYITVLSNICLLELLGGLELCGGAIFKGLGRSLITIVATYTVLATGGWAGIFSKSTASPFARGEGIGAAARLGAQIADMEFIQYVPFLPVSQKTTKWRLNLHFLVTVFGVGELRRQDDSSPLTELGIHHKERAPKEVISLALAFDRLNKPDGYYKIVPNRRAILEADTIRKGISNMLGRLPNKKWNRRDLLLPLFELLRRSPGIPVEFAAHFTMGGVVVNRNMATTVPGLYAIGECRSGLWGAGRVYSACSQCHSDVMGLEFSHAGVRIPDSLVSRQLYSVETVTSLSLKQVTAFHEIIHASINDSLGLIRTAQSLRRAELATQTLLGISNPALRNQAVVLSMAIAAALAREETRGCHIRAEHLECSAKTFTQHISFRDRDNQIYLERMYTVGSFTKAMNIEEQIKMLQDSTTKSKFCNLDNSVNPTD